MAGLDATDMRALESAIDDLSANVRATIASAYEYASTLDKASWEECLRTFLTAVIKRAGYLSSDDIAASLGLPPREARNLVIGLSATAALLTDTKVSSGEFVAVAEKALLTPKGMPAAKSAAEAIVGSRVELERALTRRRIAASVLPALESFEVTVDLRFRFADDKIEEAVPVAIVRIDTDAFTEQLWIQLALADVEELLKKLGEAHRQLEALERIPIAGLRAQS